MIGKNPRRLGELTDRCAAELQRPQTAVLHDEAQMRWARAELIRRLEEQASNATPSDSRRIRALRALRLQSVQISEAKARELLLRVAAEFGAADS